MVSKLLASPYLLPHGAASGKGSEGPTEHLLLWLSFHTTHGSRWASPSPLEVCLRLKLSRWVSVPGLGRPSPAPCSSAHRHGQQMPPGERRSAFTWCHLLWGLPFQVLFCRTSQIHRQRVPYLGLLRLLCLLALCSY